MDQTTQLATARLTSAEAYKRHIQTVRRNAAIERQRIEVRADIERVQALYAEGAPRKAPVEVAPQFTETSTYTVTHLAGGLKASVAADKAAVTRRKRVLDNSPEAEAKREKRRARRAARKARQAAAQG
jgi:hypothetical protein